MSSLIMVYDTIAEVGFGWRFFEAGKPCSSVCG
jgi:hypothetical protein